MKKMFLMVLILLSSFLSAHQQDLLKESDIHRIMKQILENHLGDKTLTAKIWQNALITYINQFDPDHIYLLSNEVEPYIHLSPTQIETINQQYTKSDFKVFNDLNQLFQRSIHRFRDYRKLFESDKGILEGSIPGLHPDDNFSNTLEELKRRQKSSLFSFLQQQHRQFGNAKINQSKSDLIKAYEDRLRSFENQYLFVDETGKPLSVNEKENLITIQILKALAGSLDAHTSFYEASEAYDIKTRLMKQVDGVGIEVEDTVDGFKISKIVPGSPADKNSSIQVGDILNKIDGESITAFSLDKITRMLHEGSKDPVELELSHPKKTATPYKVQLKRAITAVDSDRVDVSYETFGSGIIAKLRLHSFYQNDKGVSSAGDIEKAIIDLQKKGSIKGLLLDLRDNSGGFLSQAVKVAGLFIKSGVIVISKYSNGEEKFYRDVDGKAAYEGPLVVLVSKITASAAEIVAQALQDYGVAVIVGDEHTYGKGTIQMQTVTDNAGSSYFKVTVGKYYTVSGKTPQKKGVLSDIIVPGRWDHINVGEEFLNSEKPDAIPPSYEDALSDLSDKDKSWYLKYYVPKEQKRVRTWYNLFPALRKNSEKRMADNKNYQFYLNGNVLMDSDEDDSEITSKKKNYGEDDLQLQEAVNVVKDMIILEAAAKR
jgi:carboxyl-terminal processing protease